MILPADPTPDLHRPRGPALDGLSVVVTAPHGAPGLPRAVRHAHAAAAAVAREHEVVVLDEPVPPGSCGDLAAAASAARHESVVLTDVGGALALGELGRGLRAAARRDVVLGRRLGARPPRPRRPAARDTPWARGRPALPPPRARGHTADHPFVLLPRTLARSLGALAGVGGGDLTAADVEALADAAGVGVTVLRVHERPAHRP